MIVRQGETGDRLYVVFCGEVEVLREATGSRPQVLARLGPGDIFGEMALLGDGVRTRSVRAGVATTLLVLTKATFDTLVVPRLSRENIEVAAQKIAFLGRAPLSCRWSPGAMATFASRSQFQVFRIGQQLVQEGETNQFFHLVHEGELSVRREGREVARLSTGDFFGEISLLQNSEASASIVALTTGRCLVMPKHDFLKFITQDYVVGFQIEDAVSQRLGQPIFPLGRAAFADTIRN